MVAWSGLLPPWPWAGAPSKLAPMITLARVNVEDRERASRNRKRPDGRYRC
jgi:hypothetical protein